MIILLFVHKRKKFTLIKSPTNDNRQPSNWTAKKNWWRNAKMNTNYFKWMICCGSFEAYSAVLPVKFHVSRNPNIPYNNHPFNRSCHMTLAWIVFFFFYISFEWNPFISFLCWMWLIWVFYYFIFRFYKWCGELFDEITSNILAGLSV